MATESKGLSPTAKCKECGRAIALRQFGRHMRANVDEVCHESAPETPANEHIVTIRLPESKIAKLLELLLA